MPHEGIDAHQCKRPEYDLIRINLCDRGRFTPHACSRGTQSNLDKRQLSRCQSRPEALQYVVEETLAGRANRIKAYSIATIAFGRDPSFDPQSDPIVRIEAGHVRRALERYYQSEGHDDPIRITIPTGGYVPTFSQRCAQEGRTGFEVEINGAMPKRPPVPGIEAYEV